MSNVMIRGLMKVHNKNRRSQNEQARELAHIRHRAYRGVETIAPVEGERSARHLYLSRSHLHQVITTK